MDGKLQIGGLVRQEQGCMPLLDPFRGIPAASLVQLAGIHLQLAPIIPSSELEESGVQSHDAQPRISRGDRG
jgi:hypothetical protein